MSESNFLAGQASIWVQPDGPNTQPQYLGCHGVGDVTEPKGDRTLLYCPDRSRSGGYVVKNSFRGEPGAVTATIDTDLRKTADYLESLDICPVPIYVHKVLTGRRDTFANFDRSFAFFPASVTQRTLGALASRTPGDENESTQSFDISADNLYRFFTLEPLRVSLTETEDITGIAVCGEDRCETESTASQKQEDYIFIASKALVGSAANTATVLASIKGAVFTATAGDPFAGGEDIQGIVCFRTGKDTIRVLVARGTTDAGDPAEIAYSDDLGATWTNVSVGSVNGEYVSNGHALFALDRYHIWMGTDGGRIYFSSDGGESWVLQENAAISATDVVGISFVDSDAGYAVYTGGEVAKTIDGSSDTASWSATTVSGLTTAYDIVAISPYFVYAVGAEGKFYSHDGGSVWGQRDSVATFAIDFFGSLLSLAVGSAASAAIKQSINGGYDWSNLTTIANAGFLDVLIVNAKLAYVTGKASGGTGFVAKLLPQA